MPSEGLPPHNGGSVEVVKSPNDKKQYRYMLLENGLQVLLISDPEMQATTAAEPENQVHFTDTLHYSPYAPVWQM